MDGRKVIPVYVSFYEASKDMSWEDRGKFFYSICAAYLDDPIPDLQGAARMAFNLALPSIETSKKKSESRKRANTDDSSKNHQGFTDESSMNHRGNEDDSQSLLFTPSSNTPSSEKIGDRVQGKGEDQRKVQWAENVSMTNEEHAKLVSAHGEADTERMIVILDNYKGSTGKRYKSDYRAILSWVVDKLAEEKAKKANGKTSNPFLKMLMEEGSA